MELLKEIEISELELLLANSIKPIYDLRKKGSKLWFEYHCLESEDSADAKLWKLSHQQVEVISFSKCDPLFYTSLIERSENACQLVYVVRFADGSEFDVFEDELLNSIDEFERPDPPKEK